MPVHDDLGLRLKGNYEHRSQTKLIRRMPVAIRIDGKAFHTFTRGMRRPFDPILMDSMQETMKYLCENIQGTVLGYTQSDEITLILVDYKTFHSDAWFDYEVQKMCSISASLATMKFNQLFGEKVDKYLRETDEEHDDESVKKLRTVYAKAKACGGCFDSRCFNIPKEEVTNLIYWRQIDAARNSVSMVGRAYFSHKQLDHKTSSQIQDMLMLEHNVNWNNFPIDCKRGACCIKKQVSELRTGWVIDREIPLFKGEYRDYIESLILPEEE